jgi:hypothetical protein
MFNIAARALVDTDPSTAGVLQGAASMLVGVTAAAAPRAPANTTAEGPPSFVTTLRRRTTELLRERLGPQLLDERRAVGRGMDDDAAVAYALDAITRARRLSV